MDTKYFYVKDNEPVGPLTIEELLEKDINSKTQIWTKGMEKWDLLESMPELYKALQLKKENPPHYQKVNTTNIPKENTTQIKVEPVTPENTLNPNKISTKTILYLIVGGLIVVMLGGYLFLKLEVEKVKAENSRIEKELEQKQELIEKQLAEEQIKLQKEKDIISKDIDGNVYKVVKIGTQYWSGRNLNVSRFRNGDKIPVARSAEDWIKAGKNGQPACCCYDNVGYNCEKYGRLYNWYAVNDPRGLAPDGWHVPTDYEWKNLTDFLGVLAGQILKSTEDWEYLSLWWLDPDPFDFNQGTDDVGFSAFPGGWRDDDARFVLDSHYAEFWSATDYDFNNAWYRTLSYSNGNVKGNIYDKSVGASVRCIKD
jgi:uncharacterized protein (TIGR02145 family)